MKKIILLILLFMFSCKKEKTNNKVNESNIIIDKIKEEKQEIKFVTAKSGLIFRDKPKGERLGKFGLGSKLTILEKTDVTQEISNKGEKLKGKWVGVKFYNKKVYVFDGFLSDNKPPFKKITFSSIKNYLYDGVWVPSEFINKLNKTKSYSQSLSTTGPDNILFYDNNQVNIISEGEMEEHYLEINKNCEIFPLNYKDQFELKILEINANSMLIENSEGLVINYFKVYRPMRDDGSFTVVRDGIKLATQNWFAGIYKLSNEEYNYTITYTKDDESLGQFFYDESFEVIKLRGKFGKILKIENNTYYFQYITNPYSEEESLKFEERIHTLTKISD